MIRLILILLCGVSLQAHSLKVFASQDGDFVVIKSYFYGNSPCRNCNIDIIKDDKIIQNAKTDENGVARLKLMANEFDKTIWKTYEKNHNTQLIVREPLTL